MEKLFRYLNSIQQLSADELTIHLQNTWKGKTIHPGDFLLKQGQVSNDIFFIAKGLLGRLYPWKNHIILSCFKKEGEVVINPTGFFTQTPGNENIEALQAEVLYCLLEKYYVRSERYNFYIHKKSGKEKYQLLMKVCDPDLVKGEDLNIGNYLGISLPYVQSG